MVKVENEIFPKLNIQPELLGVLCIYGVCFDLSGDQIKKCDYDEKCACDDCR